MYKTFWLLFQQIKDTKIIPNIPHTSLFTEFSLVFMQIKKKIQLIYLLKLIMLFYVILFSKSADS